MKLTMFILLSACMAASAAGHTQGITLKAKDQPLEQVLTELKKQSGYNFVYTGQVLQQAGNVTVDIKNTSLEEAIRACLKNKPLTYTIVEKIVVIKLKAESPNDNSAVSLSGVEDKAPPIDIKGRVVDENGKPVIASVQVKGTNKGTTTNDNGEFELKGVDDNATLVISGVSIESFEVKVNGRSELALSAKVKTTIGEEVQVFSTGYQQIPKERATGSFVKVDNELFNRRVSPDVISRLNGIASGVLFDKNAGLSGFNIRGLSTIFANNSPLIVINNFPYSGNINDINPNDVENVTILKDAAATSIWGVKAGNGVVVITTKKGRFNQPIKVSLNSNITFSQEPDLSEQHRMTSADYIEVERTLFDKGFYNLTYLRANRRLALSPVVAILEKRTNGVISATEADAQLNALKQVDVRNDLEKYFYRRQLNQQYNINISGGGNNNSYYVSTGFDKIRTTLAGNNNNRISFDAGNIFGLIKNRLEVSTNIYYTQKTFNNNASYPIFGSGVLYPYAQLADANGSPLPISRYRQSYIDTAGAGKLLDWNYRPLEELSLANNKTKATSYYLNLGMKYTIVKGISLDVKYQYENGSSETKNLQSQQTFFTRDLINQYSSINRTTGVVTRPIPLGAILDLDNSNYNSHNFRSQINFSRRWSRNEINSIGGFEIRDLKTDGFNNRFYGYDNIHGTSIPVDYVNSYPKFISGSATIPNRQRVIGLVDRYVSAFFNGSYTLQEKYTVSASLRRDASNLFGVSTNQKWVPLWSAGASWNISDEEFYKSSILPYLKLRTTFGYQGNVDKNVTAYLTTQNIGNNLFNVPSVQVRNPPNPELRWERSSQLNLAIDFGFKKQILGGSIEVYKKKGNDLMGDAPLAASTGLSSFRGNTANIKASGIDFTLNTKANLSSILWRANLLISYNKDEVTQYNIKPIDASSYVLGSYYPVGSSITSLYSFKWGGLNPSTGDPQGLLNKQISQDYDKILHSTDMSDIVYGGSQQPRVYGGLLNSFSWKQLSLSFNIVYKFDYVFRRSSISYDALFNRSDVGHSDFSLRWQKAGDEKNTNVPSMIYPSNYNRDQFYLFSEALVEKGDHVRLQDVQLSYEIIKSSLPFKSIKLFGYANNLGIIWRANKHNLDPDLISTSESLPTPISFSFGTNIGF